MTLPKRFLSVTKVQVVVDKMNNNIPAIVRIEQPEIYIDYPSEDMRSMVTHSWFPSNSIKLEPACGADIVQTSVREIISEGQTFDNMDCKISASVKIEQSEAYVDYLFEDEKLMNNKIPATIKIDQPEVRTDYPGKDMRSMVSHNWFPSNSIKMEPACGADIVQTSAREIISEGQTFDKMDCKIPASVKIEQSKANVDYPFEDEKILPCSQSCSSLQGQFQMEKKMIFGNIDWKLMKQEQSDVLFEDKSHIRVVLSQQEKYYSHMSDIVSPVIENSTAICLVNENCQLENIETPVKLTQVSGKSLDCTVGCASSNPQRIQTEDTPHMSNGSDVTMNVDTFLLRQNARDTGKKPITKAGYLKHHVTHTGEKSYKCEICTANFAEASHLKRHMRTHAGEKPYKCDVCPASFARVLYLKCHMRTHTGEKPFKCDVCSMSFPTISHLKTHMRTHTGEKPFMCDVCAASFAQPGSLKYHMRTHTGEKPYKCDVCAATFARDFSLTCHMRTHTGEKPYKCDVCAVSFTTTSRLKSHTRTHTGEKPFKCNTCAASFARACSLNYHIRTHRRETLQV